MLKLEIEKQNIKNSAIVAIMMLFMPITVNASGRDLIYEIHSNSPPKDLSVIQEELDQLPKEVVDTLENNDVVVKIIDKGSSYFSLDDGTVCLARAISPQYYVYYPSNKVETIKTGYIECYTSELYNYEYGSLTHEVGHELDYLKAIETGCKDKNAYGYSGTEEWEQLYKDNKNILSKLDSLTKVNVPKSKAEGFAEAFRLTMITPDKIKSACPDVYEYICSLFEKENNIPDSFDYASYADRYPDLKKAFGYDKAKLYEHYVRYGIAEGRTIG